MHAHYVLHPNSLHDDTEEDLVGADWHQDAIRTSGESLKDVARERDFAWHIGDQLPLVCTQPDGSLWRPSPDIMLHAAAGATKRAEMTVRTDGVPELIIEVASPSTWKYDVNVQDGKAWGYLELGVPNYLVFDPHGTLLGEPCRGWQRREGRVHAWLPAASGRYHTVVLDLSFQPEDELLRVFDPDGRPMLFAYEKTQQLQEQRQVLRAQDEAIRMRDEALRARDEAIRVQDEALRADAARIAVLEAALARLQQQE